SGGCYTDGGINTDGELATVCHCRRVQPAAPSPTPTSNRSLVADFHFKARRRNRRHSRARFPVKIKQNVAGCTGAQQANNEDYNAEHLVGICLQHRWDPNSSRGVTACNWNNADSIYGWWPNGIEFNSEGRFFSAQSRYYCHNVAQLNHHPHHQQQQLLLRRSISTTGSRSSWMESIKGVFTGKKKEEGENPMETAASFTLTRFADELKKAQKVGSFKQYIVGRSSEATFSDAFAKMEAVIRYLSTFDPAGEQAAAKHCNCTIAEVESALAKFTWAKQAQAKLDKMKEEGKPMPKSLAEVQKLMGNTPMDLARSNLAKSGQISRNAFCPCGSKKRYKKCCGKDKEAN
ncbi:hypothetical protein LINPERHAP2_LOCUS36025, partial [Linum perenne]